MEVIAFQIHEVGLAFQIDTMENDISPFDLQSRLIVVIIIINCFNFWQMNNYNFSGKWIP